MPLWPHLRLYFYCQLDVFSSRSTEHTILLICGRENQGQRATTGVGVCALRVRLRPIKCGSAQRPRAVLLLRLDLYLATTCGLVDISRSGLCRRTLLLPSVYWMTATKHITTRTNFFARKTTSVFPRAMTCHSK